MNARAQFASSSWLPEPSRFESEAVEGGWGPAAGDPGAIAASSDAGRASVSREPNTQQPVRGARRMRLRHWRYLRRTASEATVSIHVRDFAQLFNSLDPSPLWDRDLDRAVAQFIEDEFRDRRLAGVWRLKVYAPEGVAAAADLQSAVKSYYRRSVRSARIALREHMKVTRIALVGGALIFLLSTAVRGLIARTLAHPPALLDQGLIVLAWLGLWRPIEALVYEWVPFYRRRRLYERLAQIHVTVRTGRPGAAAVSHPAALAAAPAQVPSRV